MRIFRIRRKRIPDLLAALDGCADMVVGSRYVAGGEIDQGWSAWRHLNSRLATMLARPLVACKDPLAGFFALDRNTLPDLGATIPDRLQDRSRVDGAGDGSELPRCPSSSATACGARASSIGDSSSTTCATCIACTCSAMAGWLVWRASWPSAGSGFVIDVAFYLGLQWLGIEHRLARFLSFWPAVTWNWRLNRALTFAERPWRPRARQWAQFVGSSLLGLGLNVGTYAALTSFVAFFRAQPLAGAGLRSGRRKYRELPRGQRIRLRPSSCPGGGPTAVEASVANRPKRRGPSIHEPLEGPCRRQRPIDGCR